MEYPFGIENYPDLPLRLRTMIMKEWNRRDQKARPPGRPSKYPWNEWMDGKTHSALAGRDFHQSSHAFRNLLRQKAYHSGMTIWTEIIRKDEKGPTGPTQFWVAFRFAPKDSTDPVDD